MPCLTNSSLGSSPLGAKRNSIYQLRPEELDFSSLLSDKPYAEVEGDSDDQIRDGIRRPKHFTKFVMLVCRRWFSIAVMPSNSQLWVVRTSLSSPGDFAPDFTRFHSALWNSRGADLDVHLIFVLARCHPLVIHALSLLRQYRSQLKAIVFSAPSAALLSCIYHFLQNLDGASRLEWIKIEGFITSNDQDLGHHIHEMSSLYPIFLANKGIPQLRLLSFACPLRLRRDAGAFLSSTYWSKS